MSNRLTGKDFKHRVFYQDYAGYKVYVNLNGGFIAFDKNDYFCGVEGGFSNIVAMMNWIDRQVGRN